MLNKDGKQKKEKRKTQILQNLSNTQKVEKKFFFLRKKGTID